jgi:hypothetical protein
MSSLTLVFSSLSSLFSSSDACFIAALRSALLPRADPAAEPAFDNLGEASPEAYLDIGEGACLDPSDTATMSSYFFALT